MHIYIYIYIYIPAQVGLLAGKSTAAVRCMVGRLELTRGARLVCGALKALGLISIMIIIMITMLIIIMIKHIYIYITIYIHIYIYIYVYI